MSDREAAGDKAYCLLKNIFVYPSLSKECPDLHAGQKAGPTIHGAAK